MRIDDPKVEPYLALAEELHLPILVHTAIDDYSSILHLETVAKRHPNLTFIAAHMELYTDHDCTIEAMKRNPNIYCDTAWVEMKDAARAIEEVGKERVLFGSDAPLDGETTLDEPIYQNYFENSEGLDEESYALLMGGNAKRIFRI
jgi:predicted TIM-barrel fold metal-dependent hydrolase